MQGKNPKAFTFRSARKAQQKIKRAADLSERKKHIPWVDRTPVEPPPYVIAIVGPSKVGKTTLIRALVKHYIRQNITEINGMSQSCSILLTYFRSRFVGHWKETTFDIVESS